MEQATNQFSKGLQLDTNPMVQGNDTLSDALNATFITMNGDEVILQNDMGNRRVDGAFLPPGYQPVGMKEYGGIIYVASYNPITNRSQIGSFPSPERNIQPDEFDGKKFINLDQVYNFETRVPNCFYTQEEEGIPFLVNKSFLIPITDDTSLHAGDKFTIYSDVLNDFRITRYYIREGSRRALPQEVSQYEYDNSTSRLKYTQEINPISNFNNISYFDESKVNSPKNEKYTLAIGVMNSQNEFVDITKSLVRWDENGKIINTSEDSELLKFNKGYFIAPIKTFVDNTINDNKFIENRQISALNTYSFKLVGPLYLKATLNTIQSFSYTLITDKNENYVTVIITADIDYNCPDGVFIQEEENNYGYYSLAQGKVGRVFTGFDFYTKTNSSGEDYKIATVDDSEESNPTFETTYNVNTNLYHVQIIKKYNLPISNYQKDNKNQIIPYYICVSDCSDYYIKDLSHKGEIDILLINSGTVQLSQWNYNWKNKVLNYELALFPTITEKYQDLYLHYKNITNQRSPLESILLIKGDLGQGIIHQSYSIKNLEPDSMYICSLSYTSESANSIVKSIGNIQKSEESEDHASKRLWIMTTPFFDNETRKDFSTIEQVYVPYDFDAKLEVNKEAITYNEYEKIPYIPSQTEPESQTFDFTNIINCKIPISTTYNNQTTLKDIPEEVAILDFQGQEIEFNINQYTDTYQTLDTQTQGNISDWTNKTKIGFTIKSPNLKLQFFVPTSLISHKKVSDFVNSITYSYSSQNIVYEGNQLRYTMIIPFQKNINSTLTFSIKENYTFDILAHSNLEVLESNNYKITFNSETSENLYLICNIRTQSGGQHQAPEVLDTNTTSFNYIIKGVYNDILDATFKQPALFSASQQDVTVRNYLTSAKDALSKLVDEQLRAPQVEIEYFIDKHSFYLEQSLDSSTEEVERLKEAKSTPITDISANRKHIKADTKIITEIKEDNADWILKPDDNRIIYTGVGEDLSSEYNISEYTAQELEKDHRNVSQSVIRTWIKYITEDNQLKYALLHEYPTNFDYWSYKSRSSLNITFKDIRTNLKNSSLLDRALVYYGKFSNDIKQAKNLWAIDKINYYFISEIEIQVTLDYTYVIPDNPDSGIKINNLLEDYNGQIPLFNLQFPTLETRTKSTEFNLYSNLQENTKFASDMSKLLSSGSYIDYWSDNPVFNKHLDEIDSNNTLFKIQRIGFNPDSYYIYIGTSIPTGNESVIEPEEWQETGFTPPQPPFSWPYNAWFKLGSSITNFVWNDNHEKMIYLIVSSTNYIWHARNNHIYIAIPYENNNNLLTLLDKNNNLITLHSNNESIIEFKNRQYKIYSISESELDIYTLYVTQNYLTFRPKIQYYNLEQEAPNEETDIDIEEGTRMIENQWNKSYLYGSTKSEGFWPSLPITTGPRDDIKYLYQIDQNDSTDKYANWGLKMPMLDLTECPKINI